MIASDINHESVKPHNYLYSLQSCVPVRDFYNYMLGLIMKVGGVVAQHDLYSLQIVCGGGGSVVGSLLVRVIFYIFVNPNTLPVLSIILD